MLVVGFIIFYCFRFKVNISVTQTFKKACRETDFFLLIFLVRQPFIGHHLQELHEVVEHPSFGFRNVKSRYNIPHIAFALVVMQSQVLDCCVANQIV